MKCKANKSLCTEHETTSHNNILHEDEETIRFIYRPPKMDPNEPLYQNLETKEGDPIKFILWDGKEVTDLTDSQWIANFHEKKKCNEKD